MTPITYLIEPKAPLVIRSGRPFDGQAGADEARFPPPSTLAGTLRTAHAESAGKSFGPDLAKIAVAGPLPVRLGDQPELLVPKPADALYFWNDGKTEVRLVRAAPQKPNKGEGCDLAEGLLPVQLTESVKSKPASGPRWWAWSDLVAWRSAVPPAPTFERIQQNGWSPLPDEMRTHVGIQADTQAAESGKLFQTAGLDFWCWADEGQDFPGQRIGLVGRIAGEVAPGLVTLGGERRLSAITPAPASLWPEIPGDLVDRIQQAGGLTLTLLTPALFAAGWKPPEIPGLTLVAAALDGWQAHSGWDLAAKPEGKPWQGGQPRAGRKLVPAGAVYWYKVDPSIPNTALAGLWLTHIGDCDQDCRDGFGLVLPMPWTPV